MQDTWKCLKLRTITRLCTEASALLQVTLCYTNSSVLSPQEVPYRKRTVAADIHPGHCERWKTPQKQGLTLLGAHQSSHSPRASTYWGAMYNITMTGSGQWLQAGSWVRTGTFYIIVKPKARVLLKSALLLSGWIMHCLVHYRLFRSIPGPCL